MLRGRIVAASGVKRRGPQALQRLRLGAAERPRPDLYRRACRTARKVVDGEWWDADYRGPPLVSLEKKIADGLGLKLGDDIAVNVLGRDITAKIGNLRTVDWQRLGINFVLVFSPNTFAGAPHTHIATLTEADRDADRRRADHQAGGRRLSRR